MLSEKTSPGMLAGEESVPQEAMRADVTSGKSRRREVRLVEHPEVPDMFVPDPGPEGFVPDLELMWEELMAAPSSACQVQHQIRQEVPRTPRLPGDGSADLGQVLKKPPRYYQVLAATKRPVSAAPAVSTPRLRKGRAGLAALGHVPPISSFELVKPPSPPPRANRPTHLCIGLAGLKELRLHQSAKVLGRV